MKRELKVESLKSHQGYELVTEIVPMKRELKESMINRILLLIVVTEIVPMKRELKGWFDPTGLLWCSCYRDSPYEEGTGKKLEDRSQKARINLIGKRTTVNVL